MNGVFEKLTESLQELGLVFEKADADETLRAMLEELKVNALSEAREHCGYLRIDGNPVSKEQFDGFNDAGKAEVIKLLGAIGIKAFLPRSLQGKIDVVFSAYIQHVLACSTLVLLNGLENLDGAINAVSPEVEFTVQAPLGGKQGLMKSYMLIQRLYPWCKEIKEVSTNEVSATKSVPASKATEQKTGTAPKGGFWKKLFGK